MPREMFSQTSLPTEFERRWELLRDEILTAGEGTLQDDDALTTLIDRRARLDIPRLNRDATKFSVEDQGTTTQVLADIPYDGYAMCFYYKPSTIYGSGGARWGLGRQHLQQHAEEPDPVSRTR
jgi:hypothetical protein